MKNIWIFAEQINSVIQPIYFELLNKSKELYPNESLIAVIIGYNNKEAIETLRNSGVSTIINAEHEKLFAYHPDYYAKTMEVIARQHQPEVILIGATPLGSELAPSVAAKLKTGLAAHCVDLCVDKKGDLITLIPAFGGKLLGEIIIPESRLTMATVKPGVFQWQVLQAMESVTTLNADTSFLKNYNSKITLVGIQEDTVQEANLEDAEIVICAGLGISSKENWKKVTQLAKQLRGTLGYTRPVVDMGYVENESAMIGTSGKVIHSRLYLGFGVSGATHHVFGMKDAKTVISVNSDPEAAIFKVSDYKVVGDSGQILDELLEALKA